MPADLVRGAEMEPQQFSEFRHEAVHQLTRLNEECEKEFCISSWPRWDYDLERGTLTFSQEGVPKVVASIESSGRLQFRGAHGSGVGPTSVCPQP